MRLYLSGAVSYNPEEAKIRFIEAEERLKDRYTIFNPYTYCEKNGIIGWKECMALVLPEIFKCDGVAVVDACHESLGRDIELHIAEKMCMPIQAIEQWEAIE